MLPQRLRFYQSLLSWVERVTLDRKAAAQARPLLMGLSAPQGAGKTTIAKWLVETLPSVGLKGAAVSIDDFYLTRAQQVELAQRYPANRYVQSRGYPGTHDIDLGTEALRSLKNLEALGSAAIPAYDKSMHGGRGDRLPRESWPLVSAGVDVVLVEGWMLGFAPVELNAISDPSFALINTWLAAYGTWWSQLEALIHLDPKDIESVIDWRMEAERNMRSTGRMGMSDEETRAYIEIFLPAYKAYLPGLRAAPPTRGPLLRVQIGADRLPVGPS